MDDATMEVARKVAAALEKSGRTGLRLQVEKSIANHNAGQLSDPVAIAALVISVATLAWRVAWDVYLEHQKRRPDKELDAEVRNSVEKSVKEELNSSTVADQATRALLIKATTEAVLARLAASR